jgi:hypothetical protein
MIEDGIIAKDKANGNNRRKRKEDIGPQSASFEKGY